MGEFVIGMAWLLLIATFATYSIYYTALRICPAAKVSAAIYVNPPVTMICAWGLFSEPLTLTMFAGLAVAMLGVFFDLALTPADETGAAHGRTAPT